MSQADVKKIERLTRFFIGMNIWNIIPAKMETCKLCKNKFDAVFEPGEHLLGTQISDVIKYIYSDDVSAVR